MDLFKAFSHDPPATPTGIIDLHVAKRAGKSIATRQYTERALKIIRPHYLDDSGQVFYTIINPGGGYVGGDAYELCFEVSEGAAMLLSDQSALKVYRTPDTYVVQNIEISVAAGALLEYIPDQVILYRGADFRQQLRARIHPEGSLLLSEVITPGWSPTGEQFRYRHAHLRTLVYVGDELALIDNVLLPPQEDEQEFYLGGHTHLSTLICFDPALNEALLAQLRGVIAASGVQAAITATQHPGFVVRGLGDSTEELLHLNLTMANHLRAHLRGQGPIRMRKY